MVLIRARVHPFPSRTRKLSSLLLTILGWRRPGKIGSANTEPRDESRGVLLCRRSEFGMPTAPSRDRSMGGTPPASYERAGGALHNGRDALFRCTGGNACGDKRRPEGEPPYGGGALNARRGRRPAVERSGTNALGVRRPVSAAAPRCKAPSVRGLSAQPTGEEKTA